MNLSDQIQKHMLSNCNSVRNAFGRDVFLPGNRFFGITKHRETVACKLEVICLNAGVYISRRL